MACGHIFMVTLLEGSRALEVCPLERQSVVCGVPFCKHAWAFRNPLHFPFLQTAGHAKNSQHEKRQIKKRSVVAARIAE